MTSKLVSTAPDALVGELRTLIEQTRGRVAQTVNSELVWLHWQLGARLRAEVLDAERAAYGEQVVAEVAQTLTAEFGRGFSRSNLYYMMKFAEAFPRTETVHALRGQLVRVASYLTQLPPRELLERKLLESIEHARARTRRRSAAPVDEGQ